ncbi:MAG TPA: hypothetical protein VFW50_29605, partial [Streptosporangiaceae bacterium]|nr:hypothetical protein [Streptosporangiaceae bacterium]
AGVVTSKLLLVYIAIGVSGLALLALGAGAAVHWRELTGKPETAAARAGAQATSSPPAVVPSQVATPEPAATPVASAAAGTAASRPAWSGAVPVGSSRPGYPPPATRPPAPGEWKWRDDPAPREAAAEKPAASLAGQRDRAVADDQPSAPDDDRSVQDQTMIFRAQPDQTMIFRAQPAAVAEEPATRTPGEPAARTSAEPAPAAHAPVSDVTAAPEDTAAAADTARESAGQESESIAAESTVAESAPPASDPEPAADTPASPAATSAPTPGPAPTPGSTSDDDAPSKADGQADPAPATEPEPEPADDIAPADHATPSEIAPSEIAPSEDEPADEATTITKAVAPASGAASGLEVTEVTVVPGVPRYHRASCILIRFMGDSDLDKMTVAAAKEAGCTSCRACLPDQPEESPE